jgi:hypothetical protein
MNFAHVAAAVNLNTATVSFKIVILQ